jgi:hypothetical protein
VCPTYVERSCAACGESNYQCTTAKETTEEYICKSNLENLDSLIASLDGMEKNRPGSRSVGLSAYCRDPRTPTPKPEFHCVTASQSGRGSLSLCKLMRAECDDLRREIQSRAPLAQVTSCTGFATAHCFRDADNMMTCYPKLAACKEVHRGKKKRKAKTACTEFTPTEAMMSELGQTK